MSYGCRTQLICLALCMLATPTWMAKIKLTALKCQNMNPVIGTIEQCIMKAHSREVKELNVYIKVLQKPLQNITLHTEIKRRFKTPFAIYDTDACQFMRSKKRNPIAEAMYSFLRLAIYSNFNHTCPFYHDIIVDRLRIADNINMPVPLNTGEYVITSHWYVLRKLSLITRLNFVIDE